MSLGGYFLKSLREKPLRYYISLFFFSSTVIFSPLFITYLPDYPELFLYMFRMSIPLAAFGLNILIHKILVWRSGISSEALSKLPYTGVLLIAVIASNWYFVPAYSKFQVVTSKDYAVADFVMEYYAGGVIICDDPTMNYRFVETHRLNTSVLLSNHYSPHRYGLNDPVSYASWFHDHNITLWMHTSGRSEPVWRDIGMTKLLSYRGEIHGCRIYSVNFTCVNELLLNE